MNIHKSLVLATSFLALGFVALFLSNEAIKLPDPIFIDTKDVPTVGAASAPIHVVVFQDFKCSVCQEFNEQVFPLIKEKYINTGKIRYTLIPLAFLDDSERVGNAILSVYNTQPDRLLPYLEQIQKAISSRHTNWDSVENLLFYAVKVGGINLIRLEVCLKMDRFFPALKRNFAIAREIMGKDLGTPSVYVNGIPVPSASFHAISKRIERSLKE